MMPPPRTAGFTLIELVISLGLFALIAVAGLALLDGVLGVEGRTGQRLDRTADFQRAMFVLASDFDQIAVAPLTGDAAGPRFARAATGSGGPVVPIAYRRIGDTLVRIAGTRPQRVLAGVDAARWRYYDTGWIDRWPPSDDRAAEWPRAVAVDMQVRDQGGAPATLRRVVTLPVRAGDRQ